MPAHGWERLLVQVTLNFTKWLMLLSAFTSLHRLFLDWLRMCYLLSIGLLTQATSLTLTPLHLTGCCFIAAADVVLQHLIEFLTRHYRVLEERLTSLLLMVFESWRLRLVLMDVALVSSWVLQHVAGVHWAYAWERPFGWLLFLGWWWYTLLLYGLVISSLRSTSMTTRFIKVFLLPRHAKHESFFIHWLIMKLGAALIH